MLSEGITASMGTQSQPKSRVANYTIQGFLYQFNKTLLVILDSTDDAEITVEGLIEDIDIKEPLATTAIQCKYHESQTVFSLSLIYKPILQMMDHFHRNQTANVNYRLFAHFPNVDISSPPQITEAQLNEILNTTNKDFAAYTTALKGNIDISLFHQRFSIDFGTSLDDIETEINKKLTAIGFQAEDLPYIIYPNAIHIIAQLSIEPDATERITTKTSLLGSLHTIKKTTISRWTLALKTAKQILEARKKQLQPNLAKNARKRSFLISETVASDFHSGIVVFITDYLDKYHSKVAHTETPLFCFDCATATLDDIRERIYQKGIRYNDGYIGARFDADHLARAPIVSSNRAKSEREFSIRLMRYETDPNALNSPKCDDFFILSATEYPPLNLTDVNEERLSITTLQQAKFLLGVSNVYE